MAEPEDRKWEEYKLLQGKLDGLGTFKFQIRGWAVTLMVAFLVSGTAANFPAIAFLFGLAVVGLFYLLDSNQQVWQTSCTKRLSQLETQLVKHGQGKRDQQSPGVVRTIRMEFVKKKGFRRFLLRQETGVFYFLLTALIIAFTVASVCRPIKDPPPTKIQIVSPSETSITGASQ